jgi:hypothetical protein
MRLSGITVCLEIYDTCFIYTAPVYDAPLALVFSVKVKIGFTPKLWNKAVGHVNHLKGV